VSGGSSVVRGGCRIAYRARGEGDAVLLIQGVGVHGDGWVRQVDRLCPRFRCITPDNRGTGASELGAEPITVPLLADDALAVLDAEGVGRAHVIGHSLGGLVAQHMALVARERVKSLSLFCTFANGARAGRSARMFWLGLRTRIGTKRMRRRAFLEIVLSPRALASRGAEAWCEELAPIFGHDLATQPPVAMAQLRALRGYDATPRLFELAGLPTLVVAARHDMVAPPELGLALAAAIPGARFHEVPDASHGVIVELPDAVDALLRERLSGGAAHASG
jgi:pimeloyl-ACP methyl ester carboxylesterase